ncbi:CRTAC1 family protein, partial [bacterium]|nr:CRTAC1 family protein [bacterium]
CSMRIGESDVALALGKRLADLDKVFRFAKDADAEQARWIAQTLQDQVRPWESAAWLMRSGKMSGTLRQLIPELNRREQAIVQWEQAASSAQVQKARVERILGFSVDQWPAPEMSFLTKKRSLETKVDTPAALAFEDVAASVGIDTTFVSGFPLDGGPFAIHEVNGGGLAAFDYDRDGRCDIYIVQSGGDPRVPDAAAANQLFRLLPEQRFQEVTGVSLAGDRKFGQGVCAGDLNQDGFPDLLIANIGSNSIYLNQGDGTFREANEFLGDNPFQWTSSIALGDLNGDHLPDLVEINYVDDVDGFDLRCDDNYIDCQPQDFRKCPDRVLLADAKGHLIPNASFSEASPIAKLGFGLVMANFDNKHGNDFFISNDGDFNHYWQSQPMLSSDSGSFGLVEVGNLKGCSVGRAGKSQACMGIASGDFDRNGTLDLHVTNFTNEPVNLFLQSSDGIFVDEVSRKGLAKSSFSSLGFGTQAADFDNDGWLDLAVLNGHVYDARAESVPFRMLPQLFEGSRKGFQLHARAEAGDYWNSKKLGRTLATLDWNHDGRIDLIASHLDQPIALLQNNSVGQNWLQVELVGTTSEREGIGAQVQVVAEGERWTGWQTGGDGLMCSNEPLIHFGIGDVKQPVRIEVLWPSGLRTVLDDLPVNRSYLVIEGQLNAFDQSEGSLISQ